MPRRRPNRQPTQANAAKRERVARGAYCASVIMPAPIVASRWLAATGEC